MLPMDSSSINMESTRGMNGEEPRFHSKVRDFLKVPAKKLVGYCGTPCQGKDPADTTYYHDGHEDALCARGPADAIVRSQLYNAGVRNLAAANYCATQPEPYTVDDLSETNSLGEAPPPQSQSQPKPRRRRKERFNYAKALLHSDRELEKHSWKIRAEIQQIELEEVALEAERSATLGVKTFSSRRLSFDVAQKSADETLLRGAYRRQSSSGRSTWNSSGVSLSTLQPIESVIPDWKMAHRILQNHANDENTPFRSFSERPRKANVDQNTDKKEKVKSLRPREATRSALLDAEADGELSQSFSGMSMKGSDVSGKGGPQQHPASSSPAGAGSSSSSSSLSNKNTEQILKDFFYYAKTPESTTTPATGDGVSHEAFTESIPRAALCYTNESGPELTLSGLLASAIQPIKS